jgi:hypothetical protein
MELEERREMEAGVLVFHVQAWKAFGLREQVKTLVMLVYDNQEGKKKFILLNRELAKEIHGKISLWLDANMCFRDIVHRIGAEGVDIDEWNPE